VLQRSAVMISGGVGGSVGGTVLLTGGHSASKPCWAVGSRFFWRGSATSSGSLNLWVIAQLSCLLSCVSVGVVEKLIFENPKFLIELIVWDKVPMSVVQARVVKHRDAISTIVSKVGRSAGNSSEESRNRS